MRTSWDTCSAIDLVTWRIPTGLIIPFDDLPCSAESHRFIGAAHGDVPFSVILVHSPRGGGPKIHRHPYPEVFIVEAGEATFTLGDDQHVVTAGHLVIGPPMVPHGFTNTGARELRIVAIHANPTFITEWLTRLNHWSDEPMKQDPPRV